MPSNLHLHGFQAKAELTGYSVVVLCSRRLSLSQSEPILYGNHVVEKIASVLVFQAHFHVGKSMHHQL